MDAVRQLILDKLEEHGLRMRAVSLKLGRNHAYLSQFIRGTPAKLPEDERRKLARLLHVDEAALRSDSSEPSPQTGESGGNPPLTPVNDTSGVREGPTMQTEVETMTELVKRLDPTRRAALRQYAWRLLDDMRTAEGSDQPGPTRVRR